MDMIAMARDQVAELYRKRIITLRSLPGHTTTKDRLAVPGHRTICGEGNYRRPGAGVLPDIFGAFNQPRNGN
jgi:hypothetical protein